MYYTLKLPMFANFPFINIYYEFKLLKTVFYSYKQLYSYILGLIYG